MASTPQGRFLFGEFQLDPVQRAILREGETVTLSPRTFDLLLYMIANAQRIVSKEELMGAVWPGEPADETTLHKHVFLLRKILTASEPGDKILVTVPGRGFQFLPSVTEIAASTTDGSQRLVLHSADSVHETSRWAAPPEAAAAVESVAKAKDADSRQEAARKESAGLAEAAQAAREKARLRRKRPAGVRAARGNKRTARDAERDDDEPTGKGLLGWFTPVRGLLAGAGIVLAAGLIWLGWRHFRQPYHPALAVIVAEMDNSTGEAQFDGSLTAAIALDMQQSPLVTVTSAGRVSNALAALNRPAVQHLTPELAWELCPRLGGQAVLESALSRVGMRYLLTVHLRDCATGLVLGQTRGLADSAEAVLPLIDRMAVDLRSQLGESPYSVQRLSKPLFTTHPPSLAGLKSYAEANAMVAGGKAVDSLPLFQHVTEIDPQFAPAWQDLASAYIVLGQQPQAVAALNRAWQLRNSMDQQSQLAITAAYLNRVTEDIPAALANYRVWTELYPRNPVPFEELADLETQIGHSDQALDPARHALRLDPAEPAAYTILARAEMQQGKMEEAAATAKLAVEHAADDVAVHGILYQLAYLRRDSEGQDNQMAWARDHHAETYMQLQQALTLFAQGRVKAAMAIFTTVADGLRQQGMVEAAGRMESVLPRILADLGENEPAYVLLQKLGDVDGTADIPVAWAGVGEATRAETLLNRDLEANPTATIWQQDRVPQIRAAIALAQGKPADAVEALKAAQSWDMRSFEVPELRGRAYLANKQPLLAEYEFLSILDHPGVEPLSHNYALAQLGLARALAQQGKNAQAAFAYRTFLQNWAGADADLPRLKEARQEYAKLPKDAASGVN